MPVSKKRKKDPASIIAAARRPEREVGVCFRPDLLIEIEHLEAEIADIRQQRLGSDDRLGSGVTAEEVALAEQIVALEEDAEANTVTFRIRAIHAHQWRALRAQHPAVTDADKAEGWITDRDNVTRAVLTEHPDCLVEPEMDAAQITAMLDEMSEGQWMPLKTAVLIVNGGDGSVPFSQVASSILQSWSSEAGSRERTGSPSNGSTDGNPPKSSPSPTGKTDARLGG